MERLRFETEVLDEPRHVAVRGGVPHAAEFEVDTVESGWLHGEEAAAGSPGALEDRGRRGVRFGSASPSGVEAGDAASDDREVKDFLRRQVRQGRLSSARIRAQSSRNHTGNRQCERSLDSMSPWGNVGGNWGHPPIETS